MQHDLEILAADANTGITFRAAVNAALQALGSCQQGGTAPTTTYPSMLWADTTANLLKMRNKANTAWVTIGTLDAVNLGLLSLAGGTLTGALTLAGAGTAALHPATLAQIQGGAFGYAVDSGSADALVATLSPAITTLTPGMVVKIKAAAANATATPTLNLNGLGAKTINRNSGALLAGDIKANGYSWFMYYETGGTGYFMLLNPILTGSSDIAMGAVNNAAMGAGAVTTEKMAAGAATEPYILIQDQKASGTGGGTFTSGAWQTRDLNTEVADTGGNASLNANQITLAAGTYRFKAIAPAVAVQVHQARLYDVTNAVVLAYGTSGYDMDVYSNTNSHSFVMGRFTLAGPTVIELQHRCALTQGNGFGAGNSFGGTQIYSTIEFWKEV